MRQALPFSEQHSFGQYAGQATQNLERHDQIFSTVVGSYPTVPELTDDGKAFFDQQKQTWKGNGLLESYFDYLTAHAIIDQLFITVDVQGSDAVDQYHGPRSLGLDVVSTGQASISHLGNMNVPLYSLMKGVESRNTHGVSHTRLTDDELKWNEDLFDGSFVMRECCLADSIIDAFRCSPSSPQHSRVRLPKWKLSLAGPATLSAGIHQGNRSPLKTSEKMVDVLLELLGHLKDKDLLRHVHHIQIDEPILTQVDFVHYVRLAIESTSKLIREIHEKIQIPVSLHMCGPFEEGHLSLLQDTPLYALDLEIAYYLNELANERERSRSPLNELEKAANRLSVAKWSLGLVNSSSHRVETQEEITTLATRLGDVVDKSKLLYSPDCGLRGLGLAEARGKLTNMLKAVAIHRDDLVNSHLANSLACQERISTLDFDSPDGPAVYGKMARPFLRESPFFGRTRKIVRAIDEKLGFLHASGGFSFFSVHDHKHSRRVIYYVNQLLGPLFDTYILGPFKPSSSDQILRILFVAAYGHDVGLYHPGVVAHLLGENTKKYYLRISNQPDYDADKGVVRGIGNVYPHEKLNQYLEFDADRGWTPRGDVDPDNMGQCVRAIHGFRSGVFFNSEIGEILVKDCTSDGKPDPQRQAVALEELRAYIEIVQSHQSSSHMLKPHIKKGTNEALLDPVLGNMVDDLTFFSVVLRIADECDMAHVRLPPGELTEKVAGLAKMAKSKIDSGSPLSIQEEDAFQSEREYKKMRLISHVHIDHFEQLIRVCHDPKAGPDDLALVNDVCKHIKDNLETTVATLQTSQGPKNVSCRELLEYRGILLRDVIAEPARPLNSA